MKTKDSKSVGGNQVAANAMIFENPEFGKIRTLTDEKGEPLFCGKDVCDALGYKRANSAVRQHVNIHDAVKHSIRVATGQKADGTPAMKCIQMLFVNESGFYSLVFGSKQEAAKRFTHWVTSEVLPQIRKHGYYAIRKEMEQQMQQQMELKDKLIGEKNKLICEKDKHIGEQRLDLSLKQKLIGEQDVEIRRLNGVVDSQMVRLQRSAENLLSMEDQVDRLLPKALYADNVLDSVNCYTTTQIAKELGCTAQELNRALCALGIQYYQSGQYMLYAQYAHMGLAKSRTRYKAVMEPRCLNAVQMVAGEEPMPKVGRVYTHTFLVWTERGRKFIHDLARTRELIIKN